MKRFRTVQESAASGQSGFTLIEALIAIVILAVGLVAVTNLFLVAASSNQMGNSATAAATQASETLERLKTVDFVTLEAAIGGRGATGGNPNMQQDLPAANAPSTNPDIFVGGVLTYNSYRTLPGVGTIRTRWSIEDVNAALTRTMFITVESQVLSTFGRDMTKSQFTAFRTCTGAGCP